jgi:hypothetical protein
MITDKKQTTDDPYLMIREFSDKFTRKFGLPLYIYIDRARETVVKLTIDEIYEFIRKGWSKEIKSRSRDKEVIALRQIFYKIATDEGHTRESIGKFIGRDHSTVVNALHEFNDLLSVKDKYLIQLYADITKKYIEYKNEKLRNTTVVPEQQIDPQSVGGSLYAKEQDRFERVL